VLAGLIVGLSPCVLLILPIVVFRTGTRTADGRRPRHPKRQPLLIILGLVAGMLALALALT
jgi:cytochrome c biogenesis protein CcdA